MSLYEQGVVNQRLINRGISVAQIAQRQQRSEAHIRNSLELRSAPRSIIEHVSDGRISETLALELMRKHGNEAIQLIEQGVEKAKSLGKKKVTSATVSGPKMPSRLSASAISAVESLALSLDEAVREAAHAGIEDGDTESDADATVSIPLSVVRQLLQLQEEISTVREKHAKKEARATEQDETDEVEQGADGDGGFPLDSDNGNGSLMDGHSDHMPSVGLDCCAMPPVGSSQQPLMV